MAPSARENGRDRALKTSRTEQPGPQTGPQTGPQSSQGAHHADIVEGSDEAILRLDLNGIITSWNQAAERIFGYSAEEAVGSHMSLITERNGIDRALAQRTEELLRLNEQLQGKNKLVKDFVAVVSHELRNPMSTIGGFASTLLHYWDRTPEEEKKKYLGVIEDQVTRLGRLLDDLLTISKIEAGGVEVEQIELPVVGAFRQALASIGEGGENGGRFEIDCPEDLMVMADPDHLQQVLLNYLHNALAYGAPPFRLSASRRGDFVEIRVSDSGDGVPEQFVGHLFQKFARADTSSSRSKKGTGLGLSVVKGLATSGGGDAWYEPNHPQGACFCLKLPRF